MSGWIRLHRGWRDCDVFGDEPMTEREAWLWLIEKAAWKPCVRSNAKGERVKIERGQFHTSLRTLGAAWGWGKNKVARFMERLVDHDMAGTASGQSGLVVTILNYDKYQDERDGRDTETGTASGQPRDTQEEGKEVKEESKSRKRERTPDFEVPDWVPAEPWAAYCAMRKRKKATVDSYIADKQFKKLAEIRDDGWDIAKVMDKATLNNWTDIYPPTPGRDDALRANATPAKPSSPLTPEQNTQFLQLIALRGQISETEYHRRSKELFTQSERPQRTNDPPTPAYIKSAASSLRA